MGGLSYNSGNTNTQLKFSTKELDTEAGLAKYHFGWRDYDPALARWHTTDPARQWANPYKFNRNNAPNFYDPDGRADSSPIDVDFESMLNQLSSGPAEMWRHPAYGGTGFEIDGKAVDATFFLPWLESAISRNQVDKIIITGGPPDPQPGGRWIRVGAAYTRTAGSEWDLKGEAYWYWRGDTDLAKDLANIIGFMSVVNGVKGETIHLAAALNRSVKATKPYLNLVKGTGTVLGGIGVALTFADALSNGWDAHHVADLVLQGGFIGLGLAATGPIGWTLAASYYAVDMTFQYASGRSITEHLFD